MESNCEEVVLHAMWRTKDFYDWPPMHQALTKGWLVDNGIDPNDVPVGPEIVCALMDIPFIRRREYVRDPEGKLTLVHCPANHSVKYESCKCRPAMVWVVSPMLCPMPAEIDQLTREETR